MLYHEGDFGPKGEAMTSKFDCVLHLLRKHTRNERPPQNPLYFSSEAQLWLMEKGFIILQLKGKTVGEIVSGGLPIGYDYKPRVDLLSGLPALNTHVAVQVSDPFLPYTENTPPEERLARLACYNQFLQSQVRDVHATIGSVADYIEIIDQLRRDFGTILFGKDHSYKYTATSSVLPNGLPIIVGCNSEVYGPCLETLMPDATRPDLAVAPILVPTNYRQVLSY